MTTHTKIFLILSTLTLTLGAGCNSSPTINNTDVANSNSMNTVVTQNDNGNNNVNQGVDINVDTSDLSVGAAAQEDWQTYTNKEYGFSFKYPEDANVITQETDLVSKILSGKKVPVIQVVLEGKTLLTIFPERNVDHGILGLEQKTILIGGKSGTKLFSNISSEYWTDDYPLVDAHFTILSNNTEQNDKVTVESIVSTIVFSS